jgi:radical SAM protein with 4Fe4S-binding SPASM domain
MCIRASKKINSGGIYMPQLELDPQKVYHMPKSICIEKIDNQYLIISPDTANWILAENENQLEVYKELSSGKCVIDVIQNQPQEKINDVIHILTELEAKKFENEYINYPQEHGMYVYLTNRCNQRCAHCYMYAGEEKEQELSTLEIKNLLFEFATCGGKVVTFTGGEATLRADFSEIVYSAKKNGLTVGVLSNGILWSQEFVEKNKEYIDEVQISIDGYDQQSYRAVRGTDSFDITLDAVERLLNAGIRVTIAITPLMGTLIGNESKYISFANKLIEKYKDKEFFVKFNTELLDGRTIKPTDEENMQYKKSIKDIKTACMSNSDEEGFALDHRNNTVFNNCGYGGITVASNGDVFFCNLVSQCVKQANIRQNSFAEINELSKRARELSNINNLMPCNSCSLKYLCGGGCRVKYFKTLVSTQVSVSKSSKIVRTISCTKEYKENVLRLMVKANQYFYL